MKRADSVRVEARIRHKILRHLAHQTHKRRLAKKQITVFLVLPAHCVSTMLHPDKQRHSPDLSQRLCPRSPSMRLLDSSSSRSILARYTLARCLGDKSPPRGLSASGPARNLLCPAAASFSALQREGARGSGLTLPCVATHCGAAVLSPPCGSATVTGFGDGFGDGDW